MFYDHLLDDDLIGACRCCNQTFGVCSGYKVTIDVELQIGTNRMQYRKQRKGLAGSVVTHLTTCSKNLFTKHKSRGCFGIFQCEHATDDILSD